MRRPILDGCGYLSLLSNEIAGVYDLSISVRIVDICIITWR